MRPEHAVTLGDATNVRIGKVYDIIYIDPPYTRSSDYSRQYHLSNTLVLKDTPSVTGKYNVRSDATTSRFSKRSTCREAFEELINNCSGKCRYICISYSTYALVSKADLKSLLKVAGFTNIKMFKLALPKYGTPSEQVHELLVLATSRSHDPN